MAIKYFLSLFLGSGFAYDLDAVESFVLEISHWIEVIFSLLWIAAN